MTAKTAASHVGPKICWDESTAKWEWGKLAGAYYPGDVVYESAKGTWTTATSSAGHLGRKGVVGHVADVSISTWARRDIDTAYDDYATRLVPIYTKGKVTLKIVDQNGSKIRGQKLSISSSAGAMTILSAATDSWDAVTEDDIADNDTYVKAKLVGQDL